MTQSTHHPHTKSLKLLAKITLTLAAFWFVSHGVDFASLQTMLTRQRPLPVVLAAVFALCQVLMWSLRWRLILVTLAKSARIVPFGEILKISYIGAFFNCCLPGTVGGDVVRVWLSRSERVPLSLAIHSVVIDRLMALAALCLLVLIMLPVFGKAAGLDVSPVLVAAMTLVAAGLWLLFNLERLLKKFAHIPPVRWLLYFASSLRLLLARRRAFAGTLALALLGHVSFCLIGYLLAQSLEINLTVAQALAFIPPVLLAITLPVSIGGWGVREAGMVAILGLIGVPQEAALMLSLQLGLMSVAISLPAGLLWLAYRRHTPKPGEMNLHAMGDAS